jgi:hypothetical protein
MLESCKGSIGNGLKAECVTFFPWREYTLKPVVESELVDS